MDVTVKSLAKKYGVSARDIVRELNDQGFDDIADVNDIIPEDSIELVESYFNDLYDTEEIAAPKNKRGGNNKNQRRGQEKNMPRNESRAKESSGSTPDAVTLPSPVIVKDLAEALGKRPNEIITELIKLGELAGINQAISDANAKKICAAMGVELTFGAAPKAAAPAAPVRKAPVVDPAMLKERPPVVTFMGHVDHGKTSLQDKVRHTNVTAGEAGAITQHIGASTVRFNEKDITFIDTPGHAAFSKMRARGADCTDIVVLVVSAAEGFKPQTIEAMNHALGAKVPIIVAINKIDLPEADPDRVLLHMQQNGLTSEDWGGDIGTVRVSAKTGAGIPDLLERILLEAQMLELKANPKAPADGVVLEAQLEQGFGPTAHILVQDGTLKVGDFALCGEHHGRVRTLINDKGEKVKSVPPGFPVKIVGLSGIPEAGDRLEICSSDKEARQIAAERVAAKRQETLASSAINSAEDLFSKLNKEEVNSLNIIIKADVRGSGEAIAQSLEQLPSEKIKASVVANGVGPISESDIDLAAATGSLVVGFHVRVNPGVNDYAKKRGVEIRLYSIIYELLEDITDALAGKLEPERKEKITGEARILQIFELSKGPKICGCRVDSGLVKVGAKARVWRNRELIYNGEVISLKRFKDDVREVKAGLECGIRLDNFADFIEGDEIEIYEIEYRKATL
ncbi:MAG: translation initiation factor IF-2 [Lentisphaeria bacterium]|nr:translation initiation factor IF-2 [Lentisphaerota bacterium]MBR2626540.1 translation initiation factor IF-2 [Lentisphaeria bacterium]